MARNCLRAFSLIELLVVIAIVGSLAAIAAPVYRQYSLKAKIQEAINRLESVMQVIRKSYATTGSYPNTVSVNGVTVSRVTPSWMYVGWGNVAAAIYQAAGQGVVLSYTLTGLTGIPGYTDPGASTSVVGDIISYGIYETNNVFKSACGVFSPTYASNHIALSYLPTGCQCSDVAGFLNGVPCP